MLKKEFPFFRQHDQYDCGPACLKMIAKYYGITYSSEQLRHLCNITMEGVSARGIVEGAEAIGMQALPASITINTLINEVPLPCISYWRDRHFIIVYKTSKKWVYVADSLQGLLKYSKEEFVKRWQNRKDDLLDQKGIVILLEPTPEFYRKEGDSPLKHILIF